MYQLEIKSSFDAAHHIPDYAGKCKNQHGHTYHVIYKFQFTELDKLGMAKDFSYLKVITKKIEDEYLDHKDLNETLPERFMPPTAEHISHFIFSLLRLENIYEIELFETPKYGVTYYEHN